MTAPQQELPQRAPTPADLMSKILSLPRSSENDDEIIPEHSFTPSSDRLTYSGHTLAPTPSRADLRAISPSASMYSSQAGAETVNKRPSTAGHGAAAADATAPELSPAIEEFASFRENSNPFLSSEAQSPEADTRSCKPSFPTPPAIPSSPVVSGGASLKARRSEGEGQWGTPVSLPMTSPSFDLAYFLKNTGPPAERAEAAKKPRRVKNPLSLFRAPMKRGARGDGGADWDSDSNYRFIPKGAVEKVSTTGKKYFQITPDPVPPGYDTKSAEWTPRSHEPCLELNLPEQEQVINADDLTKLIAALESEQRKRVDSAPRRKNSSVLVDLEPENRASDQSSTNIFRYGKARDGGGPTQEGARNRSLGASFDSAADAEFGIAFMDHPEACADGARCSGEKRTYSYESRVESEDTRRESAKMVEEAFRKVFESPRAGESRSADFSRPDPLAKSIHRRPVPIRANFAGASAEPGKKDPFRDLTEAGNVDATDTKADADGAKQSGISAQLLEPVVSRKSSYREELIRARKLRDLRRKKHSIEERMSKEIATEAPPTPPTSVPADVLREPEMERVGVEKPKAPAIETCLRDSTTGYNTGYTPISGQLSLSPVMCVAEEVPVARGKRLNKPARLILRERSTSRPGPVAVRTDETHNRLRSIRAAEGVGSPITRSRCMMRPFSAPASFTHGQAPNKPLPLLPATISSPAFSAITNTSTARSTASKASRLEARIERLERKNKLLEAALMAVLKSAGTMNRCPCQTLGRQSVATGTTAEVEDEKSALDVYLETRIGSPNTQ